MRGGKKLGQQEGGTDNRGRDKEKEEGKKEEREEGRKGCNEEVK